MGQRRRRRTAGRATRRDGRRCLRPAPSQVRGLRFERLEERTLLAADFGDAASPFGISFGSVSHEAIGPMLGAVRDAPAFSSYTSLANGDAYDEDGVTFSPLRVGQSATMTVHVSNAPAGARLDAWIDFGADFLFHTPSDKIANNVAVVAGDNSLTFAIPANADSGFVYARVRLSSAGSAGPTGAAADGEVEDYLLPIAHADSTRFAGQQPVSFTDASTVLPTDLDGDGDLDLLTNRYAWFENLGGRYGAEIQLPVGTTANAIAAGDVDGDGDMDFVAANSSGGFTRWYENNGSESFTSRLIDENTGNATSLAVVDLDRDGDIDIVTAGTNAASLTWYRNNGSQAFTELPIPGSTSGARSVEAVDMDDDGDLDLLAASPTEQAIEWMENDGNQNFSPRQVALTALASDRSALAADLDDDGDMDVIAVFITGIGVAWYENDGEQSFTYHLIEGSTASFEAVTAADLDGDGDLDIAASGLNRVRWYENDGEQLFTPRVVNTSPDTHLSISAADLDGDGRLDLVTTGGGGTIATGWYRQVAQLDYGDAPFPYDGVYLQDNGARHSAIGPTLGALRDAEADGSRAPGAAEAEDDGVSFGGIRVGQVASTVTVNVQNAPAGARLDAWIDFNGDGSWGSEGERIFANLPVVEGDNVLAVAVPNWAIAGATYARFRLSTVGGLGVNGPAVDGEVEDHPLTIEAAAPATGLFGEPKMISGGASFMVTADVDADGDVDVVTAAGASLAWHENLGGSGFVAHGIPDVGFSSEDFAAGDLDSDGDVDFVGFGVSQNMGQLIWMENDGNQVFTRRVAPLGAPLSNLVSLSLADIDSDGDMDVAATKLSGQASVYLLVNDGHQQFDSRLIGTINGPWATSVVVADLDRDGDLDVIAGGQGSGAFPADVAWYQNNGDLTFGVRGVKSQVVNTVTEGIAIGDLDGDGDLDFVAAASTTLASAASLTWHEQVDGGFVARTIDVGRNLRWATLADVDGDGDLDILTSGFTSSIDLYENVGAMQFLRRQIGLGQGAGYSVAAADMDGDGDLDAVATGVAGAASVAWFENLDLVDPDYGDAPDPYPTTRADDGPVHGGGGPRLGTLRNSETDGDPDAAADAHADDDGVTFGVAQVGQQATIMVNVQNAPAGALLDAWIDWDDDGSWSGAEEYVLSDRAVVEGDHLIAVSVPATARSGGVAARFRLRTAGAVRPGGVALDGEVEDYLVAVAPPAAGEGAFQTARSFSYQGGPSYDARARAGDVDGDGDQDVLLVHPAYPVTWHENVGHGVFVVRTLSQSLPSPRREGHIVDFDLDGDKDFVIAAGNGVYWFENSGVQSFTQRNVLPSQLSSWSAPVVVDMDRDGDLDVVAIGSTSGLLWLENNGAQTFTSRQILSAAGTVRDFMLADVDRDGDLDVLAASIATGVEKLAWYENLGGGSALAEHLLTVPVVNGRPMAVATGDFDDDGDLDFVVRVTNSSPSGVYLYRNAGGAFAAELVATTSPPFISEAADLTVADIDGDGRLDVLHTHVTISSFWLRNNGDGAFTQRYLPRGLLASQFPVSPEVADLDGDGDLDALRGLVWYPQGLEGDYTEDGVVDGADFLLWQRRVGRPFDPYGGPTPDGNYDGFINGQDLAVWIANFGSQEPPPAAPSATPSLASVPSGAAPIAKNVILSLDPAPAASTRPAVAARSAYRPLPSAGIAREVAFAQWFPPASTDADASSAPGDDLAATTDEVERHADDPWLDWDDFDAAF